MKRRIQLATTAFAKLKELWTRKNIVGERKKLRIYNACVKPVLTYNMCTWALTECELSKLDAFHRRQLRMLLDIRYPDIIHNKDLYKRTDSIPISDELFKSRWSMLGHVLRMNNDVPAKQAMIYYFRDEQSANSFVGRPRTTLPIEIDKDLQNIKTVAKKPGRKKNTIKSLPKRLDSISALQTLETMARGRKLWMTMIEDAYALLQSQREKTQ